MSNKENIHTGSRLRLYVDKLLHGGSGLCHHGSRACFVDYVIPGETVAAAASDIKRHYIRASLLTVDEPSPCRITPACPLFQRCGGCQWQHMTYERQCDAKKAVLEDCLNRIGGIEADTPLELIPSTKHFNYRRRATIKVAQKPEPALGYYQAKTHDIVPISTCMLLSDEINRALAALHRELTAGAPELRAIQEVKLTSSEPSQPVTISCAGPDIMLEARYNPRTDMIEPKSEPAFERILDFYFQRRHDVFSQVNPGQNERMIEIVRSWLSEFGPETVIDLYCGSGNFSLFLASGGVSVTGLDISRRSIQLARKNAEINNVSGCTFIQADSKAFPVHLTRYRGDAFLLNPPRQGCTAATLTAVLEHQPHLIVYVSCSPPTLARDLKSLIAGGYRIRRIQPLDMFPQTHHVETVVLLSLGT